MDDYTKLRNRINKYSSKYPVPSAKKNKEQFKKLFLLREELPTTKVEYDSLRETLILSNGAFAMKYAIAYSKKINDAELISDLFQQAQIGIIEAVDRFDPLREVNFTTFAYFYVRKCIIDFIKRNKVIAVNRNIARYIKHIMEVHDELIMGSNGFTPTIEDIQKYLKTERKIDVKNDVVIKLLNLIDLNSSSDLSFTTDNFDTIPYEENFESLLILQFSILQELKEINNEQLDFIKLRFGIGYDRPYALDEIKFIKDLDDETIKNLIEVSNLYIPAN